VTRVHLRLYVKKGSRNEELSSSSAEEKKLGAWRRPAVKDGLKNNPPGPGCTPAAMRKDE